MIFNKTEKINQKYQAEREKMLAKREWHKKFAWSPVQINEEGYHDWEGFHKAQFYTVWLSFYEIKRIDMHTGGVYWVKRLVK